MSDENGDVRPHGMPDHGEPSRCYDRAVWFLDKGRRANAETQLAMAQIATAHALTGLLGHLMYERAE